MSRATRFIDACYGKPVDCTPVWLMRQAGRYQASYRKIRERHSFFEMCENAELAAQVTVNAVRETGVDAGIIFSDILLPLAAMGAAVEFGEHGPTLARPIRDRAAIDALAVIEPEESLAYVMRAIRLVTGELHGEVPLIGFAGAPLTLASYLVEGGHSRNFQQLKTLLFTDPKGAHDLLQKLSQVVTKHLRAQVAAGCRAIQVFDTWAGMFSPRDYAEFGAPYIRQIITGLGDLGVPRLVFGTGTHALLTQLQNTGAEVVGIDWRISLTEARQRLGHRQAVQGNLDPCCLFMADADLTARITDVLAEAGGTPGHIFNLGHGVLPGTDINKVRLLVETVHRNADLKLPRE